MQKYKTIKKIKMNSRITQQNSNLISNLYQQAKTKS